MVQLFPALHGTLIHLSHSFSALSTLSLPATFPSCHSVLTHLFDAVAIHHRLTHHLTCSRSSSEYPLHSFFLPISMFYFEPVCSKFTHLPWKVNLPLVNDHRYWIFSSCGINRMSISVSVFVLICCCGCVFMFGQAGVQQCSMKEHLQ